MADPKAPEYLEVECAHCDTTLSVDLEDLRDRLSAHGLHIVSEADRKVLEACASLGKDTITSGALVSFWPAIANVCKAELARRTP